jgi:hypothetical protein
MRNKYSLKSRVLGKKVYSDKVNSMYESLVRSRNADEEFPKWLEALTKFKKDKFGGEVQFDLKAPKDMSEVESSLNADYSKALRIYQKLKNIPAGNIDKTKEEEYKKDIAEYVKLSKDIRRNLKKIFKKGSLGRRMELDHTKKYFKNTGTLDIEPMQDFSFRVKPQTGRTVDFVDDEGNRTPIGPDSDQPARRPSQAPQSARVQDDFANTTVKTSSGSESLGDFLKRLVQMSGVPDQQSAGRLGDAKNYPQNQPYDPTKPSKIILKFIHKGENYKFELDKTQTVGQKLGLPMAESDQLSRISGNLFKKNQKNQWAAVSKPSPTVSEHLVAAILNADLSSNNTVTVQTDSFVQGDSVAFDIKAGGGTKWEVKQLKKTKTGPTTTTETPFGKKGQAAGSAATGVGMRQLTGSKVKVMKGFLDLFDKTADLANSIQPGHKGLAEKLLQKKGGTKLTKAAGTLQPWRVKKFEDLGSNDPLWVNSSASDDEEGRTLFATLDVLEGSGAFGEDSKVPEGIMVVATSLYESVRMTEKEIDFINNSGAGTDLAAGSRLGDKSNYSFTELWSETRSRSFIRALESQLNLSLGAAAEKYDDINKNVDAINSDRRLLDDEIHAIIAAQNELIYDEGQYKLNTRPGSHPFGKLGKYGWIDANFGRGMTDEELEVLANKLVLLNIMMRPGYPTFFRSHAELILVSGMSSAEKARKQKTPEEVKSAALELVSTLFNISRNLVKNFPDQDGISSNDLFVEITETYLEDVDGFAFSYVSANNCLTYIVPRKAAIAMSMKGYLNYTGPSLGNFQISFAPPETGNPTYFSQIPIDEVPQKIQNIKQLQESYSVFNGGSPGRTLNEWVKWATK